MRYRELAKRLRRLGCEELREGKGSHKVWRNPANGKTTAVPDWGSRDLAQGTVGAII
jgi:predicted RNA binding protein YcfA (HicA-like mRNA interferase family)